MQFKADATAISVESKLTEETLISTLINQVLKLRLFSARCRESQSQALVNQDYVLANVQQDGSSLCFCVCDGVSNSYRGDFAARYLGTRLVQWLQNLPVFNWTSTSWKIQLRAELDAWSREAHSELLRTSLPESLPYLVREVLEEQRNTYGSETVFLGGRINKASSKAEHSVEIFLCWMGNITAHVFTTDEHCIVLGGDDASAKGWSTGRGLRGNLSTWHTGLTTLERLIVHTDGLDMIEKQLPTLSDEALQTQARRLLLMPQSDDMTVLTLQWLAQNGAEGGSE